MVFGSQRHPWNSSGRAGRLLVQLLCLKDLHLHPADAGPAAVGVLPVLSAVRTLHSAHRLLNQNPDEPQRFLSDDPQRSCIAKNGSELILYLKYTIFIFNVTMYYECLGIFFYRLLL